MFYNICEKYIIKYDISIYLFLETFQLHYKVEHPCRKKNILIVSPDEVGDTLVLVPSAAAVSAAAVSAASAAAVSAAAAGNCLVSGDYRPQF
jgi:hypothetical protein